MQILILGMHRSGTSVLTRLVNMMGAHFGAPESATAPNNENPKGFWERRDIRRLNDQLLFSVGADWHRPVTFRIENVPESTRLDFKRDAGAVIADLDQHACWVAKEPRFCVTLPAWLPLLSTPVFLVSVRDPIEIAKSLRARNGIPISAGIALTQYYYRSVLVETGDFPRIVVDHRALMGDPVAETRRIHAALGEYAGGCKLSVPSDTEVLEFVDPGLYRHHGDESLSDRYLTSAQQAFFASLKQGRWASALAALDIAPPESEILELYESALRAEGQVADLAEKDRLIAQLDHRVGDLEAAQEVHAKSEQALLKKEAELQGEVQRLVSAVERRDALLHRVGGVEGRLSNLGSRVARLREDMQALSDALKASMRTEAELRQRLAGAERRLETERDTLEMQLNQERTTVVSERVSWSALRDGLVASADGLRKQIAAVQRDVAAVSASRSWHVGSRIVQAGARIVGKTPGPSIIGVLDQRLNKLDADIAALSELFQPADAAKRDHSSHVDAPHMPSSNHWHRPAPPWSRAADGPQSDHPSAGVIKDLPRYARQRRVGPLLVAVIAWDTGHNPLGRAYLLAEALSRHFDVLLLGPGFERYGHEVWMPLRNAPIPVIRLPGGDLHTFSRWADSVAPRIAADVVVVCKPRLPSMQLGLLMKAFRNRPLLVDIDDYELSFFRKRDALDFAGLARVRDSDDFRLPFGESWTRFTESLLPYADRRLVSNAALQQRFGGQVIPHARDETVFDPSLYDRSTVRSRFGYVPEDRVVLFIGTPRRHKGILDVVRAIAASANDHDRLCIIGSFDDKRLEAEVRSSGGDRVTCLDNLDFGRLAETMLVGDLVCLLQAPDSEVSRYQLPAKVVDALAMGVPILATPTVPLHHLIETGAVMPAQPGNLSGQIDAMLAARESLRTEQLARREVFLTHYSYGAIGASLVDEIVTALKSPPTPLPAGALDFRRLQTAPLSSQGSAMAPNLDDGAAAYIDVVMLWKQHDSGIYGRRVDMLAKYLARDSRVRRVLIVDHQVSLDALFSRQNDHELTHNRQVFTELWRKRWGFYDTEKLRHDVFIYSRRSNDVFPGAWEWPEAKGYGAYLEECFARHGIELSHAVFMVYPKNRSIPEVIEQFRPRLVVADIVDDHRAWPGQTAADIEALTQHYREVVGLSDLVIANCETVRRSMSDFTDDVMLLTNACEVEEPAPLAETSDVARFRVLTGPKIGYVGNMEAKIDLALLEFLALSRPLWTFVMIGSTHANAAVRSLDRYPNVHFFGVIPYPSVRGWIKEMDVAIIPHLDTPQTKAMNPLKLYVYAALGVPVVSTPVNNLDDLSQYVRIADSPEGFMQAIEACLSGERHSAERPTLEMLKRHSWTERVNELLSRIEPLL